MTTTSVELPERLANALDTLRIDRRRSTVTVGGDTLSAETTPRLRRELGGALYRNWHAGAGAGARTDLQDIRRDHAFEGLLREATPHRSSKTAAVIRSAPLDGPLGRHVLFDVGRVRLRIPVDEGPHPLPEAGTRTTLELPAARPTLSPGFFLVNGSAGGPASDGDILRLYLHIDEPSMAPTVWNTLLAQLESQKATYRAKALAKVSSYPRRDAIVLYLAKESWPAAAGVVEAVRHLPGLNSEYSVMTAPVADGIAYAWEPKDLRIGWDRMSFGQHRTAVIAGAVCAHVFDGADLHVAVTTALIEANVDPLAPYRNSDSPQWSPVADGEVA